MELGSRTSQERALGMALAMRRRDFMTLVGSATAWPLVARAQGQSHVPRIGVLWHAASAKEESPYFESLIEGFRDLGYVDGKIVLEHRFPNEKPALFASMAAELVSLKPDAIVAVGGAAPYVEKVTTTIPIVFMYVPDPLGSKLVKSVRRPGGNATGLTNFSLVLCAKRLEYLKEMVPTLLRVGLLVNPSAKISDLYIEQSNAAAPKLGLTTQAFQVRSPSELEQTFNAMVNAGMQGVVVNAESLFYPPRETIAKLAIARRLPTCVWVKEMLEAGALLSYGADQRAIARRAAFYVDRILTGEKPAEMPVEQPTKFELAINLKTAKELGLEVPETLAAIADDLVK
jgi:putative tryptophan/tyrosine transport system substrate-binding protein